MKVKVYVKINEINEIIEINSSLFIKDKTNFILIDEGIGVKYKFAQSQYLEKGLMDRYGRHNYKLVDGIVTEIPEEEKPELKPSITVKQRVEALENALLEIVLGGTE